jgi:hypothetical protein
MAWVSYLWAFLRRLRPKSAPKCYKLTYFLKFREIDKAISKPGQNFTAKKSDAGISDVKMG